MTKGADWSLQKNVPPRSRGGPIEALLSEGSARLPVPFHRVRAVAKIRLLTCLAPFGTEIARALITLQIAGESAGFLLHSVTPPNHPGAF